MMNDLLCCLIATEASDGVTFLPVSGGGDPEGHLFQCAHLTIWPSCICLAALLAGMLSA